MKLLVWDFGGTLAWREGMWSGALVEVLTTHAPEFADYREELRAALQTGFPWHRPGIPHPKLSDASSWWNALSPAFVRAFQAAGAGAALSVRLAAKVRARYCEPSWWAVFPNSISALKQLTAQGWTHVMLSNHVPELKEIVRDLG